jgi:hypothetical protein
MRRLAAIITAGAVILVACSGDESATTTTTPSSVTATSAATTTSTTTSTSTTTTTTTAPTTTTVPLEVEIQAALDFYVDAFLTCGERPAECDQSFVAPDSSIAQGVAAFVQRFIDNDWYISTDRRGTYIRLTSIDSKSTTEVDVTACWYDPTVLLGAPGPDGQPTVVNDEVASQIFHMTFTKVTDRWLASELTSGEILAKDEDVCDL